MIVPDSFRRAFDRLRPDFEELKERAQRSLEEIADAFNGHYDGRIKSIQSILSKAEIAEYSSFEDMADIFAAVITTMNNIQFDI